MTTIPGLGHLHPMVPLARALGEAGHEVRVACSDRFSKYVSGAGLTPVVVGPDWVEEEAEAIHAGFMTGVEAQLIGFTEVPKKGLVTDLLALAAEWKPDVVVHDHSELGGWIAAELLGVPSVPFAMTVRILEATVLELTIAEQVGGLLRHFGLPELDEVRPDRWLYLDSIPPSFCAALVPPSETVHSLRYSTDDRTGSETLPGWFESLGDRPVVYVTLGTIFNRLPGALKKLAHGASALDVDVVLTTGRNFDPAVLGPLPERVRAEPYLPQAEVLPRCDAVVCHGGFNTVFGALSEAKPVVITPFSADQPLNAFLCDASGLGVACTTGQPEGSMFPLATPAALRAEDITVALNKVLTDSSYAVAAAQMQAEIAAQPGVEYGVALLEQLVATQAPVVRAT